MLYWADKPRLRSTTQNICFLTSSSAVILKLMVKVTSISSGSCSMIFSHFQITFQQAGICISPVILRSRKANLYLLVNPIPKLTIVLIWKTPACLKFGKTSNRGVEIWHKENSESEQRTMHVLIRIWSHRTSTSVCFFGNDRSSHSRIRTSLEPMSVFLEWASD